MKNTLFKTIAFIFLLLLSMSGNAQERDSGAEPKCSPKQLGELKNLALRSFSFVDRKDLAIIIHHIIPSLKKLNEESQARVLLLDAYEQLIGSPCSDAATFRLKRGCAFYLSKCGEIEKARRLHLESYEDSKKIDLTSDPDPLGNVIFSLSKLGFYDDALRLIEEIPEPRTRKLKKATVIALQQEAELKSPVNQAIFPVLMEEIQTFSGTADERIHLLSRIQERYHQNMLKLFVKPYSRIPKESPVPIFGRIAENLLSSRKFCLALLYPSPDSLNIMTLAKKAAFNKKIPQKLKKRFFEILFERTLQIEDFNQHASTLYELYCDRDAITETPRWKDAMIRIFRHSDQLKKYGKMLVLPGFPNILIEENRLEEAIALVKEIPDMAERNRVFLQLARDFSSPQNPATWTILFREAEQTGLVTSEDRLWQMYSQIDSELLSKQTDAIQVNTLLAKALEEWNVCLSRKDISSLPRLFELYVPALIKWEKGTLLLLMASGISDPSFRAYALGAIAMEFHDQQVIMSPEIRSDFENVFREEKFLKQESRKTFIWP